MSKSNYCSFNNDLLDICGGYMQTMNTRPLTSRLRSGLRPALMALRRWYLNHIWGMSIGENSIVSMSVRLDRVNPRGIRIGHHTAIAFDAVILAHYPEDNSVATTSIGDYCMIGARAIVYPGVTIGNNCIVAAASVVTKDIPPNSLAAGNPARVIETGIMTGVRGIRV